MSAEVYSNVEFMKFLNYNLTNSITPEKKLQKGKGIINPY